jgi:hypothetical protein
MLQAALKAYHKAIDPGKQTSMEAAEIEPAQDFERLARRSKQGHAGVCERTVA